jgi:hypothetical protein
VRVLGVVGLYLGPKEEDNSFVFNGFTAKREKKK